MTNGRRLAAMMIGLAMLNGTTGSAAARTAGPHKGRILEVADRRFEFVLDKSRRAHVYVLDVAGTLRDAGRIVVNLRANLKTGGKVVPMVATGEGIDGAKETVKHFVSKAALPSPDGYTLVLSVKANGKTANARLELVESTCGGCGLAEYACTCGH